jgi:hypothetical protein
MKSKSDPEFLNFAVENISELFGYLATGRVNIRICRDIEGNMWFVGQVITLCMRYLKLYENH